jgi:FAD:protein FMN transferase
MFTTEFHAMGSRIFLAMDSDRDPWPEFRDPVMQRFEEWEQSLSRFRSNSELSEFNSRSGDWQPVSEVFWQVLTLALTTEKKTDGLITPAVLNALEAAGYSVTFENIGDRADSWLRQPFQPEANLHDIELNESTRSVKAPKGLRLDFGGVAKGWAAQQTMLMLQSIAPVLVDAGGDIAVSAPLRDGSAWPISIADPFDAAANLGLLMIPSGGVATSGRDYRRWKVDGEWMHHLIDPRTHAPAETDVLTATVVAENVIEAESLSKQLLIQGSHESFKSFNEVNERAFLLVLESGKTNESHHFNQFRWKESCTAIQNNHLA